MDANPKQTLTKDEVREQRLQALLSSCQQQVLQQIIGPFGLTPAMFADKQGGNVTTQHNAGQGIYAEESEHYKRKQDYDYESAKKAKMQEAVKNGTMNSQVFTDEYTGKTEQTRRTTSTGKQYMNAEADHTIPLSEFHKQGGWMLTAEQRKAAASEKDNLHFTTMDNNREKGGASAESALSQDNGYDPEITQPIIDKAREAMDNHLPSNMDRVKYHGKALASTGIEEAKKNALRQALGLLMYEFVNGAFIEIKALMTQPEDASLIDRLITAFKRIADRVVSKLKDALKALISGGVQGFISNFLTFIINTVVTTSAKVVTVIRESMKGLWEAGKILLNPPKDMPFTEVCRQVTKIFSSIVTLSLGMLFEESVKTFISSVVVLAPVAHILAPAISGILTGVTTALVVYGIDRFFDWLSATDTERLQAFEAHNEQMAENTERMASWLSLQFASSQQYRAISAEYIDIEIDLALAEESSMASVDHMRRITTQRENLLQDAKEGIETTRQNMAVVDAFLDDIEKGGWKL
ncbi:Domain of uncharacterised function (DUF1994) [Campylobacter jejuni]|jgi:hypothetical protein|uniref:hypothetical protein n=1 Tax=Rahnella victoriana TaxID=1510570 RepID=UPI000BB1B392|nr:hypothetical protein [Rahnella victoriana]PBI79083.1 hypothetical protein A9993_04800 [Rahnella victoriana]VTQ53394.1 Domain of uncharacterised function (DUF1994) [Campylobacter jejuni]